MYQELRHSIKTGIKLLILVMVQNVITADYGTEPKGTPNHFTDNIVLVLGVARSYRQRNAVPYDENRRHTVAAVLSKLVLDASKMQISFSLTPTTSMSSQLLITFTLPASDALQKVFILPHVLAARRDKCIGPEHLYAL